MKKMHESMMLSSSLLSSDVANDTICDDIGEKSKVVKSTRRRWRPGRRTHYCKISQENQQAKRRRLSDEQVRFLEMRFEEEKKLESRRKLHLASETGLDPKQVSIWFQNRRARLKSKQLEDDYFKLKLEHQTTVLQKCRLEAEVLDLKQKLEEAEKKVQKGLSVAASGDLISSTNTSANSLSVDTTHYCSTPFTGEEHDHVNFLDWENFYGM